MSIFATCGHKAEWVCKDCGSCASCDRCATDPPAMVHINTREAAIAIARWAKKKRAEYSPARDVERSVFDDNRNLERTEDDSFPPRGEDRSTRTPG